MQQERYDTALLGILQHEGNISKFLDIVCSFLYRKTDFYVHLTPDGRMGFPPGASKKLVLAAYKRYEDLAAAERARKEKARLEVEERERQAAAEVAECARIEEVTTSLDEETPPSSEPSTASSTASITASSTASSTATVDLARDEATAVAETTLSNSGVIQQSGDLVGGANSSADQQDISVTTENRQEDKAGHPVLPSSSVTETSGEKKDGDDEDPELERLQKIYQANSESYNGAVRDNYSWSQSITDVDVRIKVPKHVLKARDVSVTIGKKRLTASYKDAQGKTVVAVDDDLTWEINKEESMWSLVPSEHIHVNLEKEKERWWEALIVSEPKISVRKIDPSRPMSDLDEEAQAKIDELMYNERQKQLGLPQSHEEKTHEMLRKAWDLEGSPFKGQPFDPSKINISNNNG